MIEDVLKRLQTTWGFTVEQINDLRQEMSNYALAACIDSTIRKEVEGICCKDALPFGADEETAPIVGGGIDPWTGQPGDGFVD